MRRFTGFPFPRLCCRRETGQKGLSGCEATKKGTIAMQPGQLDPQADPRTVQLYYSPVCQVVARGLSSFCRRLLRNMVLKSFLALTGMRGYRTGPRQDRPVMTPGGLAARR